MKIVLGNFNAKVGENIFQPTIGKKSLQTGSNGIRLVYFETSKNYVVKSTKCPRRNIHRYT